MRRRPLIIAATGICLLAIAYSVYWFVLARIVEGDIANWTTQQRALGYMVVFGEPSVGGFPLAVSARMAAPDITAPDGLWRWQGPDLELQVRPWRPLDLVFRAPGHHRLNIAGTAPRQIALDAGALEFDLGFARSGQPNEFEISLADATIVDSRIGQAKFAAVGLEGDLPWPAQSDPNLSSLDLTGDASGIDLPQNLRFPLGQRIDKIHFFSQLMGVVSPGPPRETLQAWRDAGGVVQLRQSELSWGPLWLSGNGTFAFDQAMQPLAAGTLSVAGLGETLDALVAAGVLEPGPAKFAHVMFAALAQPPAGGGRPQVNLPLTVQEGLVYMGPIKLARLPPLDWSNVP
jgi:hypothetical protein